MELVLPVYLGAHTQIKEKEDVNLKAKERRGMWQKVWRDARERKNDVILTSYINTYTNVYMYVYIDICLMKCRVILKKKRSLPGRIF